MISHCCWSLPASAATKLGFLVIQRILPQGALANAIRRMRNKAEMLCHTSSPLQCAYQTVFNSWDLLSRRPSLVLGPSARKKKETSLRHADKAECTRLASNRHQLPAAVG